MEFFGNDNDPLAKTLNDLKEHEQSSKLGNAGDFFSPVHERDPHVKGKKKEPAFEFNAAIVQVDDSDEMLRYIILKNMIISGECMSVEETNHVDKESSKTSVFMKWFQPVGSFELGTINKVVKVSKTTPDTPGTSEDNTEDDVVDDTQQLVPSKEKGKGTRKKNIKVKL